MANGRFLTQKDFSMKLWGDKTLTYVALLCTLSSHHVTYFISSNCFCTFKLPLASTFCIFEIICPGKVRCVLWSFTVANVKIKTQEFTGTITSYALLNGSCWDKAAFDKFYTLLRIGFNCCIRSRKPTLICKTGVIPGLVENFYCPVRNKLSRVSLADTWHKVEVDATIKIQFEAF